MNSENIGSSSNSGSGISNSINGHRFWSDNDVNSFRKPSMKNLPSIMHEDEEEELSLHSVDNNNNNNVNGVELDVNSGDNNSTNSTNNNNNNTQRIDRSTINIMKKRFPILSAIKHRVLDVLEKTQDSLLNNEKRDSKNISNESDNDGNEDGGDNDEHNNTRTISDDYNNNSNNNNIHNSRSGGDENIFDSTTVDMDVVDVADPKELLTSHYADSQHK